MFIWELASQLLETAMIKFDWNHPTASLLGDREIVRLINEWIGGQIPDSQTLCTLIGTRTGSLIDGKLPKIKDKKIRKVLSTRGIKQNGQYITMDRKVKGNRL